MAKYRKVPKQYQENTEEEEQRSFNRIKEVEEDGPVSVNRALEEEMEEKSVNSGKGKMAPLFEQGRDVSMDEDPITEEDLGLSEDSFLMDRKVDKLDMQAHMDAQEKQFVGSNVRKIRDFVRIFEDGKSTAENPKLDMAYEVDQNFEFRKRLIAQQLLRNYHTDKLSESKNTNFILKELQLLDDEDFMDELDEDENAYMNDKLIEQLKDILPNL